MSEWIYIENSDSIFLRDENELANANLIGRNIRYTEEIRFMLHDFQKDMINDLCPEQAKKINIKDAWDYIDKWCDKYFTISDYKNK